MGFGQAWISGFRNYVNFSGRAPRSAYWFWGLWILILNVISGVIDELTVVVFGWNQIRIGDDEFGPVAILFMLAVTLPCLAVSVRRLHDTDRRGWWMLLALTVLGNIFLLYWFCLKGTAGPNRFGADPLGGARRVSPPAAA
jgi:uncharacterized membrane protein YhaH (DUF805 family)